MVSKNNLGSRTHFKLHALQITVDDLPKVLLIETNECVVNAKCYGIRYDINTAQETKVSTALLNDNAFNSELSVTRNF